MGNVYAFSAYGSLAVLLWFQHRRLVELQRPQMRSIGARDIFGRYLLLLIFWPVPAVVMAVVLYGQLTNNLQLRRSAAARFDQLSGITRRVADAERAQYVYLPTTQQVSPQAPAWGAPPVPGGYRPPPQAPAWGAPPVPGGYRPPPPPPQ
jgi:hypothetical protein